MVDRVVLPVEGAGEGSAEGLEAGAGVPAARTRGVDVVGENVAVAEADACKALQTIDVGDAVGAARRAIAAGDAQEATTAGDAEVSRAEEERAAAFCTQLPPRSVNMPTLTLAVSVMVPAALTVIAPFVPLSAALKAMLCPAWKLAVLAPVQVTGEETVRSEDAPFAASASAPLVVTPLVPVTVPTVRLCAFAKLIAPVLAASVPTWLPGVVSV